MLRRLGKWFFPNLPSDLREQRMTVLLLVIAVSILMGIAVVMIAVNKQR